MVRVLGGVALAFLVLPASAAFAEAPTYPLLASFRTEPVPPGGFEPGHDFQATPPDGVEIPWDGLYSIPVAWTVPERASNTGHTPAWTSAGFTVRFAKPGGAFTEVRVRDDSVLLARDDTGASAEHPGRNFSKANFSVPRGAGFLDDDRFATPRLSARATGTYTVTLTLEDVLGATRVHTSTFRIVPRAPDEPEGLVVLPGPGFGRATLLWDRPATDGGAPLESYAVYRLLEDGSTEPRGETTAPHFVDEGLPPGLVAYVVAARNAVGEGPASAEALGVVLPKP